MRPVVALAALVGALVVAASTEAGTTYCSRTGDFCTSVARVNGVRYLRLSTFSLRGLMKICVRDPSAARVCRSFRLRKVGPVYQVKAQWSVEIAERTSVRTAFQRTSQFDLSRTGGEKTYFAPSKSGRSR